MPRSRAARPIPLAKWYPRRRFSRASTARHVPSRALAPMRTRLLAIAMNRWAALQLRRGGEDSGSYRPRQLQINRFYPGAFGVTPAYLINAEVRNQDLPGGPSPQGGHLPGHNATTDRGLLRLRAPGCRSDLPPSLTTSTRSRSGAADLRSEAVSTPRRWCPVKLVAERLCGAKKKKNRLAG